MIASAVVVQLLAQVFDGGVNVCFVETPVEVRRVEVGAPSMWRLSVLDDGDYSFDESADTPDGVMNRVRSGAWSQSAADAVVVPLLSVVSGLDGNLFLGQTRASDARLGFVVWAFEDGHLRAKFDNLSSESEVAAAVCGVPTGRLGDLAGLRSASCVGGHLLAESQVQGSAGDGLSGVWVWQKGVWKSLGIRVRAGVISGISHSPSRSRLVVSADDWAAWSPQLARVHIPAVRAWGVKSEVSCGRYVCWAIEQEGELRGSIAVLDGARSWSTWRRIGRLRSEVRLGNWGGGARVVMEVEGGECSRRLYYLSLRN